MYAETIKSDALCGERESASIEIHRPPVSQSVSFAQLHPPTTTLPREVYNCHSAGVYYILRCPFLHIESASHMAGQRVDMVSVAENVTNLTTAA